MEKNILGTKIKLLRNGKGYSQEYLSDLAQLSLRTVQRIENGETEARGDTLNRLAKALEVGIDELISVEPSISSNGYIALMCLSALASCFVYFPFLGLIIPLILWLAKKDTQPDINNAGKRILNFQLTWTIAFLIWVVFIIFFSSRLFSSLSPDIGLGLPELLLLSIIIFPFYNMVMAIINTVRVLMHKEVKYWPVIRFIR
ncbi:helix-turn-helix domain-containing protein [Mucilaginibacter boryungensis]|uniref:Helix-turn-helix domain-containing protein n=1 Tax=Mucilaginibacter boryungensis TaxID=768480 RepID=A0ABR9XFT7_9SPHI|nr:helix-turn-helix domain-containing protein [Mucilaginibacter boryungensis]MBE9665893.1 helix-turn-helix domain-containing protein [Mucilaginibacter boryungensis]